MVHVLAILFGALFTVVTSWSLGMLLLQRVEAALDVWERRLLAFVAGSACLSMILFGLCAVKLVDRPLLLALGLGIIGYAARSGAFRAGGRLFPRLPPAWRWGFIAVFAAFTWYAFFNALAPEHSSDGMAYHLSEAWIYQEAHGFPRITTDIYASLSQGAELLYLFAFEFGRHSAAALVHYTFLIALTFLVLAYGRRIGKPAVGVAAAIFTYTCPVMLRDATVAYVDVALACVLFALFYALRIWSDARDSRLLVTIGILAGFGYAVKYSAFVAVPYAIVFIIWKLRRARQPMVRPLLTVSLISAAMFVPWMLKDWIIVANPVSPFANRLFPNPYVHISFEEEWRRFLSIYFLHSRWQIPLDAILHGTYLSGFLGPVFLLTPLALLSLRYREGRQLLLAALIFEATYFSNVGTRFLIPMAPFVCLALALVLASVPRLLPAVTAAGVIACWPGVYPLYATGSWRLETVPIKAALRIEPEETYLSQDPDYVTARMIGQVVPRGERIFAFGQGGRSYVRRQFLIGYQGALNEVLQDILWNPSFPPVQPCRKLTLRFAARELRKLRVVETAAVREGQWSMAEIRVFDGAAEVPRDPSWRLRAHPNPWDVQLAFDNSPVTRWRTWEVPRPGMYVEIDFRQLQRASAVVIETSDDSADSKIRLEGSAGGQWAVLSDKPEEVRQAYTNLRLAATAELKARGIHYISIKANDPCGQDIFNHPEEWGVRLAGQALDTRVYHIE